MTVNKINKRLIKNMAGFAVALLLPLISYGEVVNMEGWDVNTENLPFRDSRMALQLLKNMDVIINSYTVETNRASSTSYRSMIMFRKAEALKAPVETVFDHKRKTVSVYLPQDPWSWKNDYGTLARLIELNISFKLNICPDEKINKVPQWIITAFSRKIFRKNDFLSLPGLSTYPNIRFVIMRGGITEKSLWSIFEAPLSPEDGSLFLLYAEACENLLDACYELSTADENLTVQMILPVLEGKASAGETFRMNAGTMILSKKMFDFLRVDGLPEKTVLSLWFGSYLETSSMRFLIPANDEYSRKLFNNALSISYRVKDSENGPGKIKRAGLTELEKDFENIEEREILISDAIKNLNCLKSKIPFAFHSSVSKIIEALSLLKSEEHKGFAGKIKEAEQEFSEALEIRKPLNECILNAEKKYLSPALKHNAQLSVIREEKNRAGLENPLLEIYLDKLEKNK